MSDPSYHQVLGLKYASDHVLERNCNCAFIAILKNTQAGNPCVFFTTKRQPQRRLQEAR